MVATGGLPLAENVLYLELISVCLSEQNKMVVFNKD